MQADLADYDLQRYGYLDKGILVAVGTVYVDADDEVVALAGWSFAYPKVGVAHRDGEDLLAGYTMRELRDIAAVHGRVERWSEGVWQGSPDCGVKISLPPSD
jgi:hypothetical protein